MDNNLIHHYTTIDTLALILKNRTIRFNRLDRVDDLEEGNTVSNGINLSKYVFVSCWTELNEESIPLWKLYANGNTGVKISLEKDFFKEYEICDSKKISIADSKIMSLLPLEELLNGKCFFVSFIKDTELFYRPIEYVDDHIAVTEQIVCENGTTLNISFGNVGKYKHKRWQFQNESRFVLTAIPMKYNMDMTNPLFTDMIIDSLKSNFELPFEDYFLRIKETAFDKLTVTLCPSATEAQKIIAQSLIKEYAPKAILKESTLKGCINLK